jgi:hypothetical protein
MKGISPGQEGVADGHVSPDTSHYASPQIAASIEKQKLKGGFGERLSNMLVEAVSAADSLSVIDVTM